MWSFETRCWICSKNDTSTIRWTIQSCDVELSQKNGKPIVTIVKKDVRIVNDIKSYEDACLDSAAGNSVSVLVSKEFYDKHSEEILKSIPEEDTCELKWYDKTKNTVSFPIEEKNWKKYFQISFKADNSWSSDASDVVAQETVEAEQAQQRAEQAQQRAEQAQQRAEQAAREDEKVWQQVAQKEQQVAQKEQQVAQKELYDIYKIKL